MTGEQEIAAALHHVANAITGVGIGVIVLAIAHFARTFIFLR